VFLDAVAVGEEAGKIPEQLEIIARQTEEQAQHASTTILKLVGFLVWAAVAIFIICLIFRLAGFYLNAISAI
jgi:type IV pilus assembly protein PilC